MLVSGGGGVGVGVTLGSVSIVVGGAEEVASVGKGNELGGAEDSPVGTGVLDSGGKESEG